MVMDETLGLSDGSMMCEVVLLMLLPSLSSFRLAPVLDETLLPRFVLKANDLMGYRLF